ncbi:MAG: tetratricopeptide repeat protein [Magnetococcales bacterium]|nr:tetratricopeptide repeat protein [Magnetococcales bacterium]
MNEMNHFQSSNNNQPLITVDEAYKQAITHFESKRYTEADQICTAIIQVAPKYTKAINLLGVIAQKLNRHDIAIDLFHKAINIDNSIALFYYNLGTSLYPLGQRDGVVKAQQRAIEIQPNYSEAYNSLGNVQTELGMLEEAIVNLQKSISLQPEYAEAHCNLGNALKEQGQLDAAITSYQKAIEIKPEFAAAHSNLGIALTKQGLLDAAITSYQKAIEIKPGFADAHCNLGNALKEQGQLDAAITSYQKAIEIKPEFAEAHYNLGNTLTEHGRLDAAITSYQKTIEIKPDCVVAHNNLIFCIDLNSNINTDLFQTERENWNKQHAEKLRFSCPDFHNNPNPKRKIKIGYVGADFIRHSASDIFSPMILRHNPKQFETYCYAGNTQEDDITTQLKKKSTHWLSTSNIDDIALSEKIREDGIDILIDLSGHTKGNRLLTFARKPAPIQIMAWGYPHGTKMTAMDYLFADPISIPMSERKKYSEKVVDLPCVIHLNSNIHFPEIEKLPASQKGYITFGAFNRIIKYNNTIYTLWSDILHRIPNAKLLIKTADLTSQKRIEEVQNYFKKHGITQNQLIMMGSTPKQEHLKTYNKIDIMLDPFPHNGGTTTLESLRMGVPVLTCEGKTRCPISASILHVIGLDNWRAKNEEDYLHKAVEFAKDIVMLKNLRHQLRNRFDESVLGNSELYVKNVEDVYRQLWKKWCEGRNLHQK